jgi:6-pyruvoyltetrahydropterin/6-carboxytetrahydropterin synthase
MYTLGMKRTFCAEHFLIGGDWGEENHPHSHSYQLEVRLNGDRLDEHGYLVDIVEFEDLLNALSGKFAGSRLNALPEFSGLNPSIEHFCRIICQRLDHQLPFENIHTVAATLWEDDIAWASYELKRG